MTTEVKLPHHLSANYKAMKDSGLINDQKEYVGTVDLAEYLESLDAGNPLPNEVIEKVVTPEEKEPSIPLSQVEEMIRKMMAESAQSAPTPQAPQYPQQPQYQKFAEYDIDDIPECRDWEIKDSEYEYLFGKPISASIAVQHTKEIPLQYFNKDTKKVQILRYSTNQPSFFQENQSKEPGSVLMSEIIFSYGRLRVPAENVNLQKFLHIHPYKDQIFAEYDPLAKSRKVVADEKLKSKAVSLVFETSEVVNRCIASLECEAYVDSWQLDILEEEIVVYAKANPQKYIDYVNDPTIKMKGVIKNSLAKGDLIYENYRFLNSKREVIVEVAKNHDEIEEMVKYLETGAGRTVYEFLLNKQ